VCPYGALVRLLPGVSAHVDHQHVLGLEGLLLPGTIVPATHKLLLLPVDVVVVDVLHRRDKMAATRYSRDQEPTAGAFPAFLEMWNLFSVRVPSWFLHSKPNLKPTCSNWHTHSNCTLCLTVPYFLFLSVLALS